MVAKDTRFVRGAERLGRRINTIRTRLALPPMIEEIANLLLKRTRERFAKEIDPNYRPWADLAESTKLRRKNAGYEGQQKLVRKGTMRDAIQIIRGGTLGTTFLSTGGGLRIGITDPDITKYARVQNQGNHHITARRFLGIGRLDVKAVDSLLRRKALSLESI